MKVFHYNDEERALHRYLAERGHDNTVLAAEADPFSKVRAERFDAAFIGLHPHGLQLIRGLHRRNPDCLVTMITADRNTRMAVETMKLGAFDYLTTPLDFTEVERTVIMMMREHEGQRERQGLEGRLNQNHGTAARITDVSTEAMLLPAGTLKQIVAEVERRVIRRSLDQHQGNISQAARALGISRTTLYTRLNES